MSRAARFLLIAGLIVFAIGTAWILSRGSHSRTALAKFKAELRAKGEKLSWQELGYPRPPESTRSLDDLQAVMSQAGTFRYHPGTLELTHFTAAGGAQVCWARPQPPFSPPRGYATVSNAPTWEAFSAQFESIADAVSEIHEAVEVPPRYFFNDPTNIFNQPKSPFVLLRNVAQTLTGDAIVALHARQPDRARADLHALIQLARFHREDLTLVSQMIRTAITGLGLAVTWEALQAPGWTEASLAALEMDWETVDLTDAFEKGMTGERAFGDCAFSYVRSASSRERIKFFRLNSGPPGQSLEDYFVQFVLAPLWRANSETDEFFHLQNLQKSLDSFRQLHQGTSMNEVDGQLKAHIDEINVTLSRPMAKYQYLISAIALPNYTRAASVCVRTETQRRLTVTAVAIERYRLRNGHPPPGLNAMVPEFLSAVPIDLMSAKPLGYKLNADGGFTLYSVGEDGRDDGGDPSSPGVTNKFDLWSGKDAVWPKAVFENEPAK